MKSVKQWFSHTRSIIMNQTDKYITYTIPIYTEKPGQIVSTEVRGKEIIVTCLIQPDPISRSNIKNT